MTRRDRLDAVERLALPVQADGLQSVEGPLLAEAMRQLVKVEDVAATTSHAEERPFRSGRLDQDERGWAPGARVGPQLLTQPLHGRVLEERCQRQPMVEGLLDLGHQVHGQDRVPAQVEEVVLRSDRPDAEHLLPDHHQPPLHLVAGRNEGVTGIVALHVRRWQRPVIDLAIVGERQLTDGHEDRGHHVARQLLREELAQRGGPRRLSWPADHVGHDPLVSPLLAADGHHRLFDVWMLAQGRFDLPQLHAETPDLHLVVNPAEVLHVPVGEEPREVARLVEAGARLVAEGIGDEGSAVSSGRLK